MLKKLRPHIVSVLIALAVGGLSAYLTKDNMDLYERIITPPLAPPSVVFPIVWSILYILMGVSAGMIYTQKRENPVEVKNALAFYAISLFANFLWSIIFFNNGDFLKAFLWLIILWILIFVYIIKYRKIYRKAGNLQIPYFLWVTFAGYLNLSIYLLNK